MQDINVNNQGVIIMGSKDKRKESKGKKPQPKPVPAGKRSRAHRACIACVLPIARKGDFSLGMIGGSPRFQEQWCEIVV